MSELTIIKHNGGSYIDSREVAEYIGKRHDHLLRDIDGYLQILRKPNAPNFGDIKFFVKSSYTDSRGREKPCYLLSKFGCELCANKLTGEKGVLFTAMYVAKFNALEQAEREREMKQLSFPRLSEFNTTVRYALDGLSYSRATPDSVMDFLGKAYGSLGIEVSSYYDGFEYYSVTDIARIIGVYSYTGRPHGLAIAAIIAKLNMHPGHSIAVPYGLVGVAFRYDVQVAEAVYKWIVENDYPHEVPHLNFDYHIYYDRQSSLFDENCEDCEPVYLVDPERDYECSASEIAKQILDCDDHCDDDDDDGWFGDEE